MVTMLPSPCAIRLGSASRQWTKTLRTLVAMRESQSASLISPKGARRKRPGHVDQDVQPAKGINRGRDALPGYRAVRRVAPD